MTTRPGRLFFVSSLAEMIPYAEIGRGDLSDVIDIVILYGNPISITPSLRAEWHTWAPKFGDWAAVLDITDLCGSDHPQQVSAALAERLNRSLPDMVVARLVLHTLNRPLERFFLQQWPEAQVSMFDNGLVSHIDIPRAWGIEPGSSWAGIRFEDQLRIDEYFFSYGLILGIPKAIDEGQIIKTFSRETLSRRVCEIGARGITSEIAKKLTNVPDNVSLVLGTSFYRTGRITRSQEIESYDRLFTSLLQEGKTILFKPHPRDKHQFPEKEDIHIIDTSIPVEFIPLVRNTIDVYSISSTALISLPMIFNTRSYISDSYLLSQLKLGWEDNLKKFSIELGKI